MKPDTVATSKELNHIIHELENAKFYGKTRYLISSKRLKSEYEKILLDAGYKVKRGLVITRILW